jgi:hypothetical protein
MLRAHRSCTTAVSGTPVRQAARQISTLQRIALLTPKPTRSRSIEDTEYESEPEDGHASEQPPEGFERPSTVRRRYNSVLWNHGSHIEVWIGGKWVEKWKCKYGDILYDVNGLSHVKNHFRNVHGVTLQEERKKCYGAPSESDPALIVSRSTMKARLVAWFAIDQMPFSQVESPAFRRFVETFNPNANDILPTADSIRGWSVSLFKQKREELAAKFSTSATSKIHLSFDGWTSPTGYSFLGVVGHWINTVTGTHKRGLLGLREVGGKHTGETLAATVMKILEDWRLPMHKVGYFVGDNASNNTTTINILSSGFGESAHIRCAGHVLNLTAKALLSADITGTDDVADTPSKWKRFTAIEKLQYIAKFIRNSPSIKTAYRDTAEFVTMVQAKNETRWNSIDKMISSVLGKEVAFDKFVKVTAKQISDNKTRNKLEASILSTAEWEELTEIHRILEPFQVSTMKMQGNFVL